MLRERWDTTTKAISVTGGVTFEELIEAYTRQARGLLKGEVDVLLVETSQDMRNVKAAYIGIQAAFEELKNGSYYDFRYD